MPQVCSLVLPAFFCWPGLPQGKEGDAMTLDKAIELIKADIGNEDIDWGSPLGEAYTLSFEALLRIQDRRADSNGKLGPLLPGETK
ncbi:hypothetical protein ES705_24866 [subsurface metagenome]